MALKGIVATSATTVAASMPVQSACGRRSLASLLRSEITGALKLAGSERRLLSSWLWPCLQAPAVLNIGDQKPSRLEAMANPKSLTKANHPAIAAGSINIVLPDRTVERAGAPT